MPQMLELIKSNAVPAAVMRSAAKGALSVSAAEMLQILVYLTRNPILGQEAAMTLARWDDASAKTILSSDDAPQEVLDYFWHPENRRVSLLPALLENLRIPEPHLIAMAASGSPDVLTTMLASARVRNSPAILEVLSKNPNLSESDAKQFEPQSLKDGVAQSSGSPAGAGLGFAPNRGEEDSESAAAHQAWEQEHAAEIANEPGNVFELVTSPDEPEEATAAESLPVASAPTGAPSQPVPEMKKEELEKLSTLQKISRMNVADRVKAAFFGNRDERSILIRDGARIVQNAVLASPKLSEPEVETFAAARNVHENVLREIARNRRFMKNYGVQRNLVQNPKCPLDISLALVKNLLVYDLKTLRYSKSVPEIIRKVAANLYREKMSPRDK
jgi:hypothetical protein